MGVFPLLSLSLRAGWQSGYAPDCKSVYLGSIPGPASISLNATTGKSYYNSVTCFSPGGEIGRRKGLM